MSYLYKRANRIWPFLIEHRLTHAVWRPLVEATRRRHVVFRRSLATRPITGTATRTPNTKTGVMAVTNVVEGAPEHAPAPVSSVDSSVDELRDRHASRAGRTSAAPKGPRLPVYPGV
jgi:hypothetical protein